jgi:glycosyltransferase involved in cell wall biosynthesis
MEQPQISVIIPVYNVENYLDECVDSVVKQTIKNIEIILIDDGSNDNSSVKCDEWKLKDGRIKVIHKKNEGLGLTRNCGIRAATGEYITFLDSDDYVEAETYKTVYEEAKRLDLDICYFKHRRFKTDGKIIEINKAKDPEYYLDNNSVRKLLLEIVGSAPKDHSGIVRSMSVCMALFKTETICRSNVFFMSERIVASEDLVFHIELLPFIERVEILPNVYYNYRINVDSITQTYSEAKKKRLLVLLDIVKEKLQMIYKWEDCKGHYYSQLLRIFKVIIKYESMKDNNGLLSKIRQISEICNDARLKEMYADTLVNDYSYRDRIYLFCMKHRLSLFFLVLYRLK